MTTGICAGCGATLQSEQEHLPGFVPPGALDKPGAVCRRCFRIRHYGDFAKVAVSRVEYELVVAAALEGVDAVLYVLDVFDVGGSVVPKLSDLVGKRPVEVVVNKIDILPRDVAPELLGDWIRRQIAAQGIDVAGVWFVSGESGSGVAELTAHLARAPVSTWCVVGMANVGKSTLLNRMTQAGTLTTSRMPGTTLGRSDIAMTLAGGRTVALVDTPGLITGRRMTDDLCADCLRAAVPQSRMRPRVFQLDAGQTLFLGGFARFDFESGAHQPIVCYVSNELTVHRTKLERADEFYAHHADDLLKAPCPDCRAALGPVRPHKLASQSGRSTSRNGTREPQVIPRAGCDVALAGLGWITLFGAPFYGTLHVPERAAWALRARMIGQISRSD